MKKRLLRLFMMTTLMTSLFTGCASGSGTSTDSGTANNVVTEETTVGTPTDVFENTEIQVFIAASLAGAMEEVQVLYNEEQPNVKISYNADSSGTLLTQVQEGYACDIFFSAAPKQMNTLEEGNYLVEGTRVNLLNNQVVLITPKDSGTEVTGFEDMYKAENMALADGSVPVGRYTRTILMN